MTDLPVPPEALADDLAREMIRVWIADGDLHVSLCLGMYADDAESDVDERDAWGQILADTVRHIANGLHQSHDLLPQESMRMIGEAFVESLRDEDRYGNTDGGYVGDEPA